MFTSICQKNFLTQQSLPLRSQVDSFGWSSLSCVYLRAVAVFYKQSPSSFAASALCVHMANTSYESHYLNLISLINLIT